MKQFKLFSLLFLLITLSSCSSDDSSNENSDPSFTVEFDGQTFVADQISATILNDVINITGFRGANQESVTITVFGSSTGTYELGVTVGNLVNSAAYIEPNNDGSGVWVALTDGTSQGQVVITEIDVENQTMSGTFNFIGTNGSTSETKEFTNGEFSNIAYVAELVNPGDDSFFAKIDGVDFNPDLVQGVATSLGGVDLISVIGTKNNLASIGITLPGDVVAGTFDLGSFSPPIGQYNDFTDTSITYLGNGTVTIDLHDTESSRIMGTFEFIAEEFQGTQTVSITEGSFDVTY